MRLQESIYIPPIISTTYSGKSNYVNGMISRLKEIINSEKSFIKPKPFDYKKYFQQTPTELRSPPLVKEMTERLSSMLAKASTPQVKKSQHDINPESLAAAKRKALPDSFLGNTPRDSITYSDKLSELLRKVRPPVAEDIPASQPLKSVETNAPDPSWKPTPAPRLSLRPIPAPRLSLRPIPAPRLSLRPVPAPRLSLRPIPAPRLSLQPVPAPRLKPVNTEINEMSPSLMDKIVTPYDNIIAAAEKIQLSLLKAINIMSVQNDDIQLRSYLSRIA